MKRYRLNWGYHVSTTQLTNKVMENHFIYETDEYPGDIVIWQFSSTNELIRSTSVVIKHWLRTKEVITKLHMVKTSHVPIRGKVFQVDQLESWEKRIQWLQSLQLLIETNNLDSHFIEKAIAMTAEEMKESLTDTKTPEWAARQMEKQIERMEK